MSRRGSAPEQQAPLIPWWPRPAADAQPGTGMVRIPQRGLFRVVLLGMLTLAWMALAGSMVLAALGSGLLLAVIAGAVLATLTVLLLRAWAAGTYANDLGYAVRGVLASRSGRWTEVTGIDIGPGRVRIQTADALVNTSLRRWSLDTLGSRDGYEAAADGLVRWYQQH